MCRSAAIFICCLFSLSAAAQSIGTIKNVDLTDERPADPQFTLVEFKMKNANHMAHIIFRQFAKRVRLEFEGEGLPKGTYAVALSASCPQRPMLSAALYKSQWTELHRFVWETSHIANEKSLPKASLRDANPGQTVLTGKSVALLRSRGSKFDLISCAAIN